MWIGDHFIPDRLPIYHQQMSTTLLWVCFLQVDYIPLVSNSSNGNVTGNNGKLFDTVLFKVEPPLEVSDPNVQTAFIT
jgi:hypothetical protein